MKYKVRRTIAAGLVCIILAVGLVAEAQLSDKGSYPAGSVIDNSKESTGLAKDALANLEVKGRSPKTGYSRDQFGAGWAAVGNCDVRNLVLSRDLSDKVLDPTGCVVLSGKLLDPYTGKQIIFVRGEKTSQDVQIDHVVALSDAWQKGAQYIDLNKRQLLANDSLNLLAVDGPENMKKGDADSATWLPPNKSYRCQYVARQIAVKGKYDLWVTPAEKDSMERVLAVCPGQLLPLETH